MFPDEDYAPAVPSFPRPVVAPGVDPSATPNKSFTIACEWLPFVRGALMQLILQATWLGDDAAVLLAQERAMTLIALFEECSTADLPFACPYDFSISEHGWVLNNEWAGWSPDTVGQWVFGSGWQDSYHTYPGTVTYGVDIRTYFDPVQVDSVEFEFGWTPSTTDPVTTNPFRAWAFLSGTIVASISKSLTDMGGGGPQVWSMPVGVMCDQIEIYVITASGPAPSDSGAAVITNIEINGSGTFDCL